MRKIWNSFLIFLGLRTKNKEVIKVIEPVFSRTHSYQKIMRTRGQTGNYVDAFIDTAPNTSFIETIESNTGYDYNSPVFNSHSSGYDGGFGGGDYSGGGSSGSWDSSSDSSSSYDSGSSFDSSSSFSND